MAAQNHKWKGYLKGPALFVIAAIAVMCAANQGCSQRITDDQEAAEAIAEANAIIQADQAKEQRAELVRQQQIADAERALAHEGSADPAEASCQKSTLYVGSIARARDNGVSLNKVLHTIDESNWALGDDELTREFNALARIDKADQSKTARDIYKHPEISPVKFQDRAYRACVDTWHSNLLKAKKEEEMQLILPGVNKIPSPSP